MAPRGQKGILPAMRRDQVKMEGMMPKTGIQIKEFKETFEKQQIIDWMNENPALLSTLIFVCKSGMLSKIEQDLHKEHWLPPSNKYVHNVSRAFYGHNLTQLVPALDVNLLQLLTTADSEAIWKLTFRATAMNRNGRVPTLHKLSYMALLKDRHTELGEPLAKMPWSEIQKSQTIDWERHGHFETRRLQNGDITGLLHRDTGTTYQFARPVLGRMVLAENWSLQDASLPDPEDEEDAILILRRFKQLNSKEWNFSPDDIAKAEADTGADAVRMKSEGDGEDASEAKHDPSASGSSQEQHMAQPVEPPPLKKARTEVKLDIQVAKAAPLISPIKRLCRKMRGCMK